MAKAYIKEDRENIIAFVPDSDIPRRRGNGILKRDRKREVKKRSLAKYDELFDCNDWNAFVTFTLSPRSYGYDRLDKGVNRLAQWFFRAIDKYKQATGHNLAYLLVPELKNLDHLHFHGATLTEIDESEVYTDSNGAVRKLWTRSTKRDRHGKFYSYYINQWILENIGRNEFRVFKDDFGYNDARLYAKKYAIKGKEVNPLAHTYYRSNGLLHYKRWKTESLQIISVIEAYKTREYKTKYGRVFIVNKEVFYSHIKRYTKNDLIPLENDYNPFYKQSEINVPDKGYIDLPNSASLPKWQSPPLKLKPKYMCSVSVDENGNRHYSYVERSENERVFERDKNKVVKTKMSLKNTDWSNRIPEKWENVPEDDKLDTWEKIFEWGRNPLNPYNSKL